MKNKKMLVLALIPFMLAACPGNGPKNPPKPTGAEVDSYWWNKALSKEAFENCKVSQTAEYGPLSEDFSGVELVISNASARNVEITKKAIKFETVKDDSITTISDAAFDKFIEENSDILTSFGTKEKFVEAFLEYLEEIQESTFVRNDTNDGYICKESLEEPDVFYNEFLDDPNLYTEYMYNPEVEKFITRTMLIGEVDGASPLTSLTAAADDFEKATYDETKKCYTISMQYLAPAGETNPEDYKDLTIDLYFNKGQFVKSEFEGEMHGVQSKTIVDVTSYGDAKVTLPTNIYECKHEHHETRIDGHYHYVYCTECSSVIEYDVHHIENGACSECGFYERALKETIKCSNDDIHISFYENKETGEYSDVEFDHMTYSGYEYGKEIYVCAEESCDLVLYLSREYDLVDENDPCRLINKTTYEFYKGDTKIHDDVVIYDYDLVHKLELVSYSDETVPGYHDYYGADEVHTCTVKCTKCGKVFENVDCYLNNSTELYDKLQVCDAYYKFHGSVTVAHDIDSETHKCKYCGKDESEVIKAVSYPHYDDSSLTEISLDEFKAKYGKSYTYSDASTVHMTAYFGNDSFGRVAESNVTFAESTWTADSEDSLITNNSYLLYYSSNTCIEMVIANYIEEDDYDVKFYQGETMGKIEVKSRYFSRDYYFDNDGLLVRFETRYIYGIEPEVTQITFSKAK